MKTRLLLAATVLQFSVLAVQAATINLKADLKGANEVPTNSTAGTGSVTATLDTDTHELKYHVLYSGLTGPAKAAHFHGPAEAGVNAKPQVPVKPEEDGVIDGSATLTAEQEKDLLDGKWYFNVHTAANPGGEIRGQVVKAE